MLPKVSPGDVDMFSLFSLRSRFLLLAVAWTLVVSFLAPLLFTWQSWVETRRQARAGALHAMNDGRLVLGEATANLLEHLWWVYDAGLTLLEGEELRPYHRWALERARNAVFKRELCFVLITDLEGQAVFGQPAGAFPPELLELARVVAQLAPPTGSLQGAIELNFGHQAPEYCLVRAEQVLSGDQPVGAVLVGSALDQTFLASWVRRLESSVAQGVSSFTVFLLNLDGQVVATSAGRPAVAAELPDPREVAARDFWNGEVYLDGTRHQAAAVILRDPHGQPAAILAVAVPEKLLFLALAGRAWRPVALTAPLALGGTLAVVWFALRHFLGRALARLTGLMEATLKSIKSGAPPPETLPELPAELSALAGGVNILGREFWHQKTHQQELAGLVSRLARVTSLHEGLKVLAYHLQRTCAGGEGVEAVAFHLVTGGMGGGDDVETFVEKTKEVPGCDQFPQAPAFCPAYAAGSFAIQDAASELPCPHFRPAGGSYRCRTLSFGGRILGVLHLYSSKKDFFAGEINTWIGELTEYSLPIVANLFMLEETTRLSLTDALTGLYNRRFLEAFLEQQLALFVRTAQPFAVLMVDLDHFKRFNDTFGHRAGDAALRAVAQVVKKSLRASDMVARYGGEEFVVVLPQTDVESALEIAERLRQVVAGTDIPDPQRHGGYLPPLTVSIGVAGCPTHALTLGALLHASDAAMYAAKRAGRNRVAVAQVDSAAFSG